MAVKSKMAAENDVFIIFVSIFIKVGYLIDFFMLNWMKYGYKKRNDQKGSKMAAKSKMAAENYVFIIFVPSLWNLGIL